MDHRLNPAPAVTELAESLRVVRGLVAGLYVGGSLATGDYRPGVSDIDAVALVERLPSAAERRQLRQVHEIVAVRDRVASLHCVYVPRGDAQDVRRRHWTWGFGELFRRELSGIARAELLADPITVLGPPPADWLPPMDAEALRAAARAELSGYCARALRKRDIWLQDVYVDIGLTTWARAEATLTEGVLITKSAAIERMTARGVPADVVDGIRRRRRGERVDQSQEERVARGRIVRRFLNDELQRLVS